MNTLRRSCASQSHEGQAEKYMPVLLESMSTLEPFTLCNLVQKFIEEEAAVLWLIKQGHYRPFAQNALLCVGAF